MGLFLGIPKNQVDVGIYSWRLDSRGCRLNDQLVLVRVEPKLFSAPIGAFSCPEIRAFMGFGGEISSTVSKVLSDRKGLFKHKDSR